MTTRKVLRMGNPKLREKSRPLALEEIRSESTQTLIQDLFETMHHEQGIGIAAPQIGENVQLCLVGLPKDDPQEGESEFDILVVINPKIEVVDETRQQFWEGCLSVPGLRGLVPRPQKIRVAFQDQEAQSHELELENFLATVFQHEIDHLFGTLYVDRIEDRTKLAFNEEFAQYWEEAEET